MRNKLRAMLAASALVLSFGASTAHADIWKGVPHAIYFPVGTKVTPEMVEYSEGPLLVNCMEVTYQVLPDKYKTVVRQTVVSALASAGGEGGGTYAQISVLGGARLFAKNLPFGSAAFGFVTQALFGPSQFISEANDRFRNGTDSCMRAYGGGLYEMGPVEAKEIVESRTPHVVGWSAVWRHAEPEPAPQSAAAPAPPAPAHREDHEIVPGALY